MTEQIKIDFEKIIKTSDFSESDIKLKKEFLNKFLANGFPSRKLENWKFSDINQIIQKNIGELSFYNDYSSSNKIDTSIFVDGLEHNKIVFINGRVEKIDFSYEDKEKIEIIGSVIQLGKHKINKNKWHKNNISKNDFFCGDQTSVPIWEDYLTRIRKKGLSCGAIIEIIAKNIPVGFGEPIYQKLDANIASALMSINAVKGVEIGDGFSVVDLTGETNADEIRIDKNKNVKFLSNHAGGILGGISSGQDIISRFVVKPTSSILHSRKTITKSKKETNIITKGRHDPCVGIRAVPVGEAMISIVLADHALQHIAITRTLKNEK